MAGAWNEIDWAAERPSPEEVEASWGELRWVPKPITAPAVDRYLAEVSRTHVNGGYVVGRWTASTYTDVTRWFVSRNRYEEYQLLHRFLGDPGVQQGLGPLDVAGRADELADLLDWGDSLTLDGELASIIVAGGAYEAFEGPAREAKQLAAAAVDALTDQRYEDIRVHTTHGGWSPWFSSDVWSHTYVVTDTRHADITVLCITDVD